MTQSAKCFRFNLADAFPGNLENVADLFQCMRIPVIKTEPHAYHLLFARGKRVEHRVDLLGEKTICRRIGRRIHVLVLDKITEK